MLSVRPSEVWLPKPKNLDSKTLKLNALIEIRMELLKMSNGCKNSW